MRHAVYSGTRNLYPDMVTAAKSLVANSSVDVVHFLVEDGEFPYELPPIVKLHDVSGQRTFKRNGENYTTRFSYMSLLRVCYCSLFPDVGKILQLDVDTVCVDDVDELWGSPSEGCVAAMVEEVRSTHKPYGPAYFNAGVAVFDLDLARELDAESKLVWFLNNMSAPYVDQDAWNKYYAERIERLDVRFNETMVTGYTDNPAIVHFAGHKDWQDGPSVPRREHLRRYREMSWEEALELHHG